MTLPAPRRPYSPEAPPYPEDPTAATRHLCAAAYLDDTFREMSLRHVYYQPRRVVAPSYGFNVVPVLGHCLKARNGAIARDAAIVLTLGIALCVSSTALLGVLSTMVSLQVTVATYRLARDTFQRLRGTAPVNQSALVPRALLIGLGWLAAFLLGSAMSGLLLRRSTEAFFEGGTDQLAGVAAVALMGSLLLTGLVFAYPVAFSLWRQSELSRLTPGNQPAMPNSSPRMTEIAHQQRGNTVVYSGFRTFVGSGDVVARWGFALRLLRPEPTVAETFNGAGAHRHPAPGLTERQREFSELPFDASHLIDYVRRDLAVLLPERAAEEQIAGLTVESRVHLAGTEVSSLVPNTDDELMHRVIRHPTTPARHYLACQVFSWGGELITTVYVHLAVQGRSLYVELTTTALPPCAGEYRIVDSVEGSGAAAWLRALRIGLVDTPATVWRAPLTLTRALINLIAASGSGVGGAARLARGYDYGARVAVRELGSDQMRSLVQVSDVQKYQSLIERRVIASILDFLEERGVDTTEYRQRAVPRITYNNNGGFNNFGANATFNDRVDVRGGAGGGGAA